MVKRSVNHGYDNPNEPLNHAYTHLLEHGLDGAAQALRIIVNQASKVVRAQCLQAMPYERSAQRVDHANEYKPKTMLTRLGAIIIDVPQVRTGCFYPSALKRGVNLALAEMYVHRVSTRKIILVLQKLLGPKVNISSTQISRCTAQLDAGLAASRNSPLGETPYVLLDARYKRGLNGVRFIASDDHSGLKAARKAMFAGLPWQRCQFHLQHNAQGYVSKTDQKPVVARQIRSIFAAPDVHEATRLLNMAVQESQTSHPKLAYLWSIERVCVPPMGWIG